MLKMIVAASLAMLLTACGGQSEQAAEGVAAPAKTYNWKLVTSWPKNYPGLGTAPETFASMVERMSAGRLKIRVYGAGELVPALEVFDTVSSGTAEMGHAGAYYWKGKIPAAAFFTTVPFGLNAREMNAWLHHGEGLKLWRELYEPFNLIPFPAGNTGVQMGGWFNREINSMADMQGLKMRIPGLGGEVLAAVGGQAVNIPGGELYTAMQTGLIDATEWVSPYNDLAFGFHQVAKYYYYPGWQEPAPTLELIVNKTAFESLPADLQAIVEVAARAANQDMLDEYTANNSRALTELVDRHGVEIRRFPDDVLAQLEAATREVLEKLAARDPMSARVYASQQAFMAEARRYQQISEDAYTDVRDRLVD